MWDGPGRDRGGREPEWRDLPAYSDWQESEGSQGASAVLECLASSSGCISRSNFLLRHVLRGGRDGPSHWSLAPAWRIWIESLPPDVCLTQLWLVGAVGEETSMSLCLSLFLLSF